MATKAQIAAHLAATYAPFVTAYETWEVDHEGQTQEDFVNALLIPFQSARCSPPLESWSVTEGVRFVLPILLGHALLASREL